MRKFFNMAKGRSRQIAWIAGSDDIEQGIFGVKSCNLHKAGLRGIEVPSGFCISTHLAKKIAKAENKDRYHKVLHEYVCKLIENNKDERFIVRSSSIYEDRNGNYFSGLFDSYLNISTTEEIIIAIEKIIENARHSSLRPYFEHAGADQTADHMAILVQTQIKKPEISGVAIVSGETAYVEYTKGHLVGIISGEEKSSRLNLDLAMLKEDVKSPTSANSKLRNWLKAVIESFDAASADEFVIEFARKKGDFYLLQVKEMRKEHFSVTNSPNLGTAVSEGPPFEGAKAWAMNFFKKSGLFSRPLLVLKPHLPIAEIESELRRFFFKEVAATIRFSSGNSIGLPRGFISSYEEAMHFIRTYYKKNYAVIVHEYLDVKRSFEILVDDDLVLIEHIPGMWESENSLQPDVFILKTDTCTCYRYNEYRKAVLEKKYRNVPSRVNFPLRRREMSYLLKALVRAVDILRSGIEDGSPLNVHAIWDGTSKKLECLNIRRGFQTTFKYDIEGPFHKVETLKDLSTWNRTSSIRLGLRTRRGDEANLISIAKALSGTKASVVVDFGLLSHPAMVLREYGIDLTPSYLVPDCFSEREFSKMELPLLEIENPIERIQSESPVIKNDKYHIVYDGDPITFKHLLCVGKSTATSVKDADDPEDVNNLFKELTSDEFGFFYERGRASFCTSEFAPAHNHFHVVAGLDEIQTFEKLRKLFGGQLAKTLGEAIKFAPTRGEYVIFGSGQCGFAVASVKNPPKRALRECAVILDSSQ